MPRNPPWDKPTHPDDVERFSDLAALYKAIRSNIQPQIDKAFDNVSRSIGFVVAATIPVAVTTDDRQCIAEVTVGGEQFKDTLFDRELTQAFAPMIGQTVAGVGAGTYGVHAIWLTALTMALQNQSLQRGAAAASAQPPAIQVSEDPVRIAAIKQAYPELFVISVGGEDGFIFPRWHLYEMVASSQLADARNEFAS